MALLNKLFFPSAPAPIPAAAAATTATATSSSAWTSSTTNTTSSTSSAASAASSSATAAKSSSSSAKRQNNNQNVHSQNYLSQFPFDGRQVRVLLYRECDSRGRRLLFDSNALQRVSLKEANGNQSSKSEKSVASSVFPSNHNCNSKENLHLNQKQQQQQQQQKGHSNGFIEVCEEYGYKHNRPTSSDITSIGEMVFGALAMSFRGTALKVHWLQEPSRILCSQVFLTPTPTAAAAAANGQSPYSTISMASLATPRTSISSEHGSIDGLSMSSFSMPFSVSVGRHMSLTPSDRSSMLTCPVDMPDLQSLSTNSDSVRADSGPRYSSTYSTGTDSGYSGTSRGQMSSDQWSSSYQYSTRSSLGSVMSEQSDPLRKLSMDSTFFPTTMSSPPFYDDVASDGSLQRRICRNLRTSFENEHSVNDLIGFVSDNYPASVGSTNGGGSEGGNMGVPNYRRASYGANESRSNPEIGKRRDAAAIKSMARRAKLGLAVCLTLSESFEEEMELFCSEHIALLESMLSRLRACAERAYINHKDFLQIMYQAWQDTQQWLNDLFTAPRIKCPVWLSITTSGSKYSKNVAERFIKELCWLLSFADTKDTNFFISTMLTAILTHHLGWVSTVSAFNSSSSRTETAAAAIEQRAKLLQVSQKHPYNALWAQMGDLFGAIGMPPKLARTVIYGTEKLSVERLLNILTYFIRCGEVRRAAKREDFNKELVNTLIRQNNNETLKKRTTHRGASSSAALRKMGAASTPSGGGGGVGGFSGLKRTQTCKQNLNTIEDNYEECSGDGSSSDSSADSGAEEEDEDDDVDNEGVRRTSKVDFPRTLKKNEIPTVLAYRDSRFVQQELRIGNYLMDTGIEKNSLLLQQQQQLQAKQSSLAIGKDGRIRLTVTTPDNIEMCVEDESSSAAGGSISDGVMEAIEIDAVDGVEAATTATPAPALAFTSRKNFFWHMVPQSVREGLSLSDLEKVENGVRLINRKHAGVSERRCSSFSNQSSGGGGATAAEELYEDEEPLNRRQSHLSLSELITQNSMGKGDRMSWGIEPIKETVSNEEHLHFDYCHRQIERAHGISRGSGGGGGGGVGGGGGGGDGDAGNSNVVFVLGDNEPLVNLKKSNEDLVKLCALHQRTHASALPSTTAASIAQSAATPASHAKKHSGVKFNFEQYPQIATNYMRSKNLVMSNYDLLMDKCTKLEAQEAAAAAAATKNEAINEVIAAPAPSGDCVVCNSILHVYQTPSNATELELEYDEADAALVQQPGASSARTPLPTVSSATSVDTLKSASNSNTAKALSELKPRSDASAASAATSATSASPAAAKRTPTYSKKHASAHHRSSTSSVAAKCAAVNEALHLLQLPVPGIKELPQDDEPPGDMKLRAGFIPSLFLNVSDHYISDMVLQGTHASPGKWEMSLREDLALAAHSASLISLPAENIAIVADMEKWDVRIVSSQAQCFPYAGGQSAPVGMSQLVSSMLETVQAMNSSGIAAYECLSFLESKMQEIYLQSETLAAFLLETDFCPLSAVTTALNLSENDVPLLLSIASIHTPQISKKCGISFR